jgi:hypothetical protein
MAISMTRQFYSKTRSLTCRNGLVHRHVPRAFPRSFPSKPATLRTARH